MSFIACLAVLLSLSSVFGFVNQRLIRLPDTIGLLVLSLVSVATVLTVDVVVGSGWLRQQAALFLNSLDLHAAMMDGALAFLLFAGALHVDIRAVWRCRVAVLALSTLSVLLATALLGGVMWLIFAVLGQAVPLVWCLVLGAVLAPTDPVAVIELFRRVPVPEEVKATVVGESLFNDGVAVTAVGILFALATQTSGGADAVPGVSDVIVAFLRDGAGGGLVGTLCGFVALWLLRRTHDYGLELTISLALATGAYALAGWVHASPPIAVVCAGLVIGARASVAFTADPAHNSEDEASNRHVLAFWEMLDIVLNALLFLLLGLSVIVIAPDWRGILAAVLAIPVAIAARWGSVWLPLRWAWHPRSGRDTIVRVLVWGGLRGGVSAALALSIPASPFRDSLLAVCYAVVLWTVIVQGLTLEGELRRIFGPSLRRR